MLYTKNRDGEVAGCHPQKHHVRIAAAWPSMTVVCKP
jgi:hypothetical protein